jgi:hypothetical protein
LSLRCDFQLPPQVNSAAESAAGNDVIGRGTGNPVGWLARSRDAFNSQSDSEESEDDRCQAQEIERMTSSTSPVYSGIVRSVKVNRLLNDADAAILPQIE